MIPEEDVKVAIIGGGAGGMAAASRIKRLRPDWRVDVFEKTSYVSHAPCGIPFYLSGMVESVSELCAYDVNFFREKRGINVHLNSEVVKVEDGRVEVLERGKVQEYEWDRLVFATGAKAKRLNVRCMELDGVLCVSGIERAPIIREIASRYDNIVIIGSGYIGVEVADALSRKKRITVIEQESHPMPGYDHEISDILLGEMRQKVNLRLGERVLEISGSGRVEKVVTSADEYRADLVILAIGVEPNVKLALEYGIEMGQSGAIKTNEYMETSKDNVYAVGDCAETTNIITGKPDWIPLAAPANKMGYVAGSNIAGIRMRFPGAMKSQITSFYDLEIGKAGLSEKEAVRHGYDAVSVTITTRSRAKYIPGEGNITLKMVADAKTHRVLGVQAIGKGVSKRIYGASALLYKKATVEDFFFADFPFYPPKSPVWDPLVLAARNMFRKLGIN
ncbi:FAD-dependent oxidoreductase [Geoglobus acetivorans]|uniref:Pyridine nucleotide-disulfide oxidoreductase n=1 Tax=Geoglobus acetivorans TaxID=565033 RepID=A0A0A7GGG6_GEOAI|nr:pyridine nucleotide-disulfide oxidoreductase [Geoglobus acetivorans]